MYICYSGPALISPAKTMQNRARDIDFKFLQHKGDKLRQVVIYTKMAHGEMVRCMMEQNITNTEELKMFVWSGYRYDDALTTNNEWVWVM